MAVGLRLNGKVIGVEPRFPKVIYTNRDAVGAWEEVVITPQGKWFDIRFKEANVQLAVNEGTKKMETRPAGDIGGWGGQWAISKDGKVAEVPGAVSLSIEGGKVASPIHLEQRGWDFVDEQGNRVVYPAVDAFFSFRAYRDNGPDALVPFFEESNGLGFKAWRIWSQGSKRQNTIADLSPRDSGYYDDVRPFTDLVNSKGIIPLWTCFVDNQDVRSPIGHWVELSARLEGSSSLLSGFNQWSKNRSDFDPWALPAPGGGLIWSRGSDVDDTITAPRGAPASELHATRNSFDRALMDATASPPEMRRQGGGMVWMTEGNPFGDGNGYSESQAWCLGRGYSILWSLAVFHNRQSQKGALMNEDTALCGAAWVKGMSL